MTSSPADSPAPGVTRYFRRAAAALPYLRPTLGMVWQAAPKWTAVWMVTRSWEGRAPVGSCSRFGEIGPNDTQGQWNF